MFTVVITEKGGAQRRMDFDKNEVTIGRVQGNDIILPKGNVSKRHSRIVLKDNRFIVVDLKSTNGTYVNGRKITSPLVVKPGDKIYIGDFILTLEEPQQAFEEPAAPPPPSAPPPPAPEPEPEPRPAPAPVQAAAPPRRRSQGAPPPLRSQPASAPPPARASAAVAAAPAPPPLPARESEPPPPPPAERFPLDEEPSEDRPGPAPRVAPARPRRSTQQDSPRLPSAPPPPAVRAGVAGEVDPDLRSVMIRLSQVFDVANADSSALHDQSRWSQAQHAIENVINELQGEGQLAGNVNRQQLAGGALREAVGLGALESLLSDDSVREIVVEGPSKIVADFGNGLEQVNTVFSSVDAVLTVARRLIAQSGEHYEHSRAIYETTLPYGPHVTVVLPPVAVRGPVIEIRRMGRMPTIDALVEKGWLSSDMLETLREAVRQRRNVLVAGAAGAGVTTLLGALAGLTDEQERLVTVEDVPDLNIDRDHVISLGAGNANGALRFRDVLLQASKLRSDRLVVDDVRGDEAWDVLATVAARRPGNFIGVHAAQGRDPIDHVKRLARLSGKDEVGDLLTQAVNLVVQLECTPDGTRRVTRIAEVVGAKNDSVKTQDLFVYDGQFSKVG